MQTQSNKLDLSGQNIYVGFDVHLKSWKVTIMTEKLLHKTFSQSPNPELLYNYLRKHFPGGTYHSAYEAGLSSLMVILLSKCRWEVIKILNFSMQKL